ncbi:MAG: tetratricopeptide repeat protein [Thermoplasmata archaeon]|nr:tetratricopeptide repeat protein [Thermoplasmata archaeon]
MKGRSEKASKPFLASFGMKETSIGRAVIWSEAALAVMVAISVSIGSWQQSLVDIFNMIFIVILIGSFILGLVLFSLNNIRLESRIFFIILMVLVGCLMVSYSSLVYESEGTGRILFLGLAAPGTALAILGIGILVVKESQASRLAGYYSLWLFGILMMLFMPLHELGTLNYSNRDLLVGYFGFGISLIGALSFTIERRLALQIDGWVTAGDAKYIAGKFDEAVEYYEQALFIEPKNAKVWSNSGSAKLRLGMWAKAVECFDKALEINPKLATAHSGRGLGLTHLKRYSEALGSHDEAIKIDNSPVGWNNRGNTLIRMGAPVKEAIESYTRALDADENYEIAWFNKGKAELMNDDIPEAIKSLTRAVELKPQFADAWFQKGKALSMAGSRDQEALYCFDMAIELKPTNADAWMERKILLISMKDKRVRPIPLVNLPSTGIVFGPAARGQPLLESTDIKARPGEERLAASSAKLRDGALRMATMGDYGSALAALDDRLSQVPDDVVTHMTKGVLLSRIEKFDEAIQAFDAAIRLKPDWVGPLFSRGMILASKGEYEAAILAMDQVTEKRPAYADAWSVKGIILGTQKKYQDAIESFDRVIELNPNSEDVWRSKSTALNKLGRYEEAIFCYEKLAALSPAIEETSRFLQEEKVKLEDAKTLFRQGVELAKSRLYDEGLALLKNSIELRPNYIDALYISGVINGVKGNYPDAMQHFERVLELRPEHIEAMYGKANILLKKGNYAKALELLDKVLGLNDQHVDAWCDRGVSLAKLGKQTDALECYDKALKLAGDHPQAIAQRERCVKAMKDAQGSP